MSIANHFNKLPKDAPLRGNLGSSVEDICIKCGSSGRNRTLVCCVFRLHYLRLKRISRVRFLVLLSLLVFLLHEASIFFDIRGILGLPQTLKTNVGLLLQLTLPSRTTNDVSGRSLSFMHQR